MYIIQFVLTIGIALCSAGMLAASINIPSTMKWIPITAFAIIFALCTILIKIAYKELKENKP